MSKPVCLYACRNVFFFAMDSRGVAGKCRPNCWPPERIICPPLQPFDITVLCGSLRNRLMSSPHLKERQIIKVLHARSVLSLLLYNYLFLIFWIMSWLNWTTRRLLQTELREIVPLTKYSSKSSRYLLPAVMRNRETVTKWSQSNGRKVRNCLLNVKHLYNYAFYPANFSISAHSVPTIVHKKHSGQQASKWDKVKCTSM